MDKRKLGVAATGNPTSMQKYLDWFTPEDLGDDIELFLIESATDDYKSCAGILLTGGTDINPDFYEGAKQYPQAPETFDDNRDKRERKIYRFAKDAGLPVLGICRGMQLVAVLEGGKLVQDLGAGNEVHQKENGIDKTHLVKVTEGTLLSEITKVTDGSVNSAHHQTVEIESLSDSLMVNAVAPDSGLIEGIEYKNKDGKPFMLCVQWHPERMDGKEESPFSKSIKDAFLAAVRTVPVNHILEKIK